MAKKIAALAAISLLAFFRPAAAQVAISQLPSATTLGGTEVAPVVQSGTTVKATMNQIDAFIAAKTHTWSASQTFSSAVVANAGVTLGGFTSSLTSPADGVFTIQNSANAARLQFGGTTSSFPALKRSGALLAARLADDSADASISVGSITASGSISSGGQIATSNGTVLVGSGSAATYTAFEADASSAAVRAQFSANGATGSAEVRAVTSHPVIIYTNNTEAFRVQVGGTYKGLTQTVSALGSAATAGAGARGFVSDATACTFGSTVTGGGSTNCPVYSDGANWKAG